MTSVLDLPIEKQEKLAALEGMNHQAWVEVTKQELASADAFRKELDANAGVRPKGWAEEDTKRFQAKVDSGNPPG